MRSSAEPFTSPLTHRTYCINMKTGLQGAWLRSCITAVLTIRLCEERTKSMESSSDAMSRGQITPWCRSRRGDDPRLSSEGCALNCVCRTAKASSTVLGRLTADLADGYRVWSEDFSMRASLASFGLAFLLCAAGCGSATLSRDGGTGGAGVGGDRRVPAVDNDKLAAVPRVAQEGLREAARGDRFERRRWRRGPGGAGTGGKAGA